MLSCLQELAAERVEDVTQFRKLYRFLDEHFEEGSGSISAAFRAEPLIYIPSSPGHFEKATEVFWRDVSWLFGDTRGYLSKPWKDFKDFFVDKLDVALTPSPQDYVDLLKELSQKTPLPTEDEPKVWEVYRELERQLSGNASDDDPTETSWWQDFIDSGLYWTDQREFWKNEDDVYVDDQDEYYDLFKGQDGFAFLKLPENRFPSFRRLIEAGGLRMLSEAVHVVEVKHIYARQDTAITSVVREAAPFIIRYLYFKENEVFRALEEANIIQQMNDISVSVCDALNVVLEFRDVQKRVARDVADEFPRLFVCADVADPFDRIGVILAKLLRTPRGLDSFICLLLTKKDSAAIERLMEAQRIPAMPTDEMAPLSPPATEDDEASREDSSTEQDVADANARDLQSDENAGQEAKTGHEGEHTGHNEPTRQPGGPGSGSSTVPSSTSERGEDDSIDDDEEDELSDGGEDDVPDRQGKGQSSAPTHRGRKHGGRRFPEDEAGKSGDKTTDERQKGGDRTPRERPGKNWFRVLARPGESTEAGSQGDPPPKDDVARQKVIEYEERRGRPATIAATNQEGYDVSSDDNLRGVKRLIEVKGLQQRWTGDATVTLTGPQFDASRGEPPPGWEYWLYVVDGLGTDSPRVHPILRFAAKVERVYLQAQDWLTEVDQADRDRLADASVEALGIPIVDFDEIASQSPAAAFLTRYPKNDLADIVPLGGFLKCLPVDLTAPLPTKGRLVMLLPRQIGQASNSCRPAVGELRWSVRQSLEGESKYVEVSLRPKTADPSAKPLTIRISMAEWPGFRPYAVCEPLLDT